MDRERRTTSGSCTPFHQRLDSWQVGQRRQSDVQWTLFLFGQCPYQRDGALPLLQGASGFANEEIPSLGYADTSCSPVKKPGSENILSILDLSRESGLGDVATCGGAGKVAFFGNRHHELHPSQLDFCLHLPNV